MIRTLKLTIAYDGTRYAGWQRQAAPSRGLPDRFPTIQGELEKALSKVLQERVTVIGSGRTDAGVHALAQVAHVRTRRALSRAKLLSGVNALLPADIAVLELREAPSRFHAQFHAASKRYRYRIFLGPVVPPFIRPYVLHVRAPLNIARMRREASRLAGRHDFKAFARAGSGKGNTVRRILDVRFARRGEELVLEVEGSGFLHMMVRSIAGTLMDVGRGRLPEGTVKKLLRAGRRELAGTTAPAKGLCLVGVTYKPDARFSTPGAGRSTGTTTCADDHQPVVAAFLSFGCQERRTTR